MCHRIAQKLEDSETHLIKSGSKLARVKDVILEPYIKSILFLNDNHAKLASMISEHESENAEVIYKTIKKHFGSLNKNESIKFIKNILKDFK